MAGRSTRTLTLLRHAKSSWDDAAACDFERPLNDKGRRAALAMGGRLRADGRRYDHVAASPARRVDETIAALAQGHGDLPAAARERRLYLASVETLLDAVRALPDDAADAMIVGHNPGIGELAIRLATSGDDRLRAEAAIKFPTATVAVIEADGDWADLAEHGGRLIGFVRPRDLDPAFGPETA